MPPLIASLLRKLALLVLMLLRSHWRSSISRA